ncbi:hypothetical protein [Winogradskyella aquimaris]|uniref:Uncharacterized protein n=1 Tax=Winogradskyella aquimaris TaxID=864074 RepID=A0ABU5EPP8_9FLAO|nr:hypothetical protein [Winogradskyella aquimaris]MDY2586846.1 hypothetical protein [Winogradskyella aquimaris]
MKIGTYFFSIFLATLILSNSLRVHITYAYYKLDPVGFIEALCENKDKPELQCNGKCHLKKVAESQNSNEKTPENIVDFKELMFVPYSKEEFSLTTKFVTKDQPATTYTNLYSFLKVLDWFHPPQV